MDGGRTKTIDTENTGRTVRIVAAYVSNNPVPAVNLPNLIETVHRSLKEVHTGESEAAAPQPAVSPKRSIRPDHLVCLECGRKFKSLKRHISAAHGLSPDRYRAKWDLSSTYPMVSSDYSEQRAQAARSMGLGRVPARRGPRKSR